MGTIAGTPSVIKQANMLLIKEYIQKNPMTTKSQIAKETQLSLVTVGKIVDELEQSGEVAVAGYRDSTGGRKAKQYVIDVSFGTVITILIRSGCYYVRLRDIDGNNISNYKENHGQESWTEELFTVIAQAKMRAANEVCAVALAVPGTVSEGMVTNIPLIPEWEGVNLGKILEEHFEIPAIVENDINASTLGSYENYGNDTVKNMLFLYLGEGIGAGVVIDNKLYKTKRNFVGELGFMNIGKWDEQKQGASSLEAVVKNLVRENRREDLADLVARLLVNTCCVIDPDLIVIDSDYLTQQDLAAIKNAFIHHLGAEYVPEFKVMQVGEKVYSKGLFILYKNTVPRAVRILG